MGTDTVILQHRYNKVKFYVKNTFNVFIVNTVHNKHIEGILKIDYFYCHCILQSKWQ